MENTEKIVQNNAPQQFWTPTAEASAAAQMNLFRKKIIEKYNATLPDYSALWRWSVENTGEFWSEIWDFCGVIAEKKGETAFVPAEDMKQAQFFPEARLNFAENLLRRRDGAPALIFRGEDRLEKSMNYKELHESVSRLAQALEAAGVEEGDRVAGYMPNMPETIIAMLAAASLGAVWVSASPDFGVQGVLDRFGQVSPKILFAVDGYAYNGKDIDCRKKLAEIVKALPSLKQVVIGDYIKGSETPVDKETRLEDFIAPFEAGEIAFAQLPFDHPLYIMFSSGTTGIPKCIVHGAGGTLLQHLKEHRLHCDLKKDEKLFYFTTCGWMMWQWLVSGLAAEATLMLYDGSPFYPDGHALFGFAEKYGCNIFGTSAKFIDALKKANLSPKDRHDLSSVRMLTSTGSPLVHEGFDYIYARIKEDIHIASISGGTDIVSCFVLGNPLSPVFRGEIQGAGLGMDVDIFDETGNPVRGVAGELVCKTPFPSMPVMFWNDEDGAKYHGAYFDRFENIWCHGDWAAYTEHNGFIIYGRSDATLNPGGVRIGTAEIYRQVEKLPEIKESIAVGQDTQDGDMRVILFVVMAENAVLDEALKQRIRQTIRDGASPRHVPAKIIAVRDIPRTKSGKITELAVRDIIHGRPLRNVEALANPEALNLYKNLPALTEE
ncbi:MAG: acetoacetate--CoA ligase [Micavibrio sp.]|nr:MAG: acetoacetate--CoA ligase [Micavibrio sp.]